MIPLGCLAGGLGAVAIEASAGRYQPCAGLEILVAKRLFTPFPPMLNSQQELDSAASEARSRYINEPHGMTASRSSVSESAQTVDQ